MRRYARLLCALCSVVERIDLLGFTWSLVTYPGTQSRVTAYRARTIARSLSVSCFANLKSTRQWLGCSRSVPRASVPCVSVQSKLARKVGYEQMISPDD
eukprot:467227-Prymnesium_polylepis.1